MPLYFPFLLLLVLAPILFAAFILRKLDIAAKKRMDKVKFVLADIFCVLFFIQLPLAFLGPSLKTPEGLIAGAVIGFLMFAISWTTIKTVSRAGISSSGWRSLVSLIVIPSTYIGSFVFIIATGMSLQGQWLGIFLMALSGYALAMSYLITNFALAARQNLDESAK